MKDSLSSKIKRNGIIFRKLFKTRQKNNPCFGECQGTAAISMFQGMLISIIKDPEFYLLIFLYLSFHMIGMFSVNR